MLSSVKDAIIGRAMRAMSDPRITRVMGDPRLMSAAMAAVGMGGAAKAEFERATRFAAAMLGLATQEEVSTLRSTVQSLEETLAAKEGQTRSVAGSSTAQISPSGPR